MTPIEKCLKTWYPPDHSLHNDPLHPAIGLAGEAGELLNLYKKEKFKDGFSWWDCVHCGRQEKEHFVGGNRCEYFTRSKKYTPKILDELGDAWYYIRILAYQQGVDLSQWVHWMIISENEFLILSSLNFHCADLLKLYDNNQIINMGLLRTVFGWLQNILSLLDTTLDQLTELNWSKLKDGDNNGWQATLE